MFCPKCGQQQISDEMRFCSRCGFALAFVSELITHDGLPAAGGESCAVAPASRRREQMRKGLLLLVGGIIGSLIFLFLTNVAGMQEGFAKLCITLSLLVALVGMVRLVITVTRAIASAVMGRHALDAASVLPSMMNGQVSGAGLPPPRVQEWQESRARTAEMVQPPSVTDRTTRLLKEDEERGRED
jgi:hypothetical protein